MVITFFDVTPEEKKNFQNVLISNTLNFFDGSINKIAKNDYKDSEIICISPKSNINKEIIDSCKNLKYIVSMSTGIDHIDYDYCCKRNIKVLNLTRYGAITVAEYQFALLLNLTRKINITQNSVKEKGLVRNGLEGTDLYNKTIGIIGYGNIGKYVAKIANSFGMNVIVNTRTVDKKLEKQDNITYVSLKDLCKISNIISINVPLTKETYHLINRDLLSIMKNEIIIINTSRGKVIDTDDLIEYLEKRKMMLAALDVIEGEKYLKGDFCDIKDKEKIISNYKKLINLPNVIVTPHNAYNTKEANSRIYSETLEILLKIIKESGS